MKRWILLLLFSAPAFAQNARPLPSGNQPVEPFQIIGNIYYVGASDVTSFLIATPKGHIVIDGGFPEMAPYILANIAKLGFKTSDIRVLLNSHAHFDHAGGLAELKRVTGAKLYASAADAPALARGGLDDPQFGNRFPFPQVEADHLVHDGSRVVVDGTALVAHITAGHTRGCTTYTVQVRDRTATRNVVFFCSPSVPTEYKVVGNPRYPNAVDDYRREFATLESLKCDVPLGSHASFFALDEKRKLRAEEVKANRFIDPAGCRTFIADMKRRFESVAATQSR